MKTLVQILVVSLLAFLAVTTIKRGVLPQKPVNIRIVPAAPQFKSIITPEPRPNNAVDSYYWLQSSFKVETKAGIGSASLIYYDPATKIGYALSCGHLWDNERQYESTQIVVYFHNETALQTPEKYPARVIFASTSPGYEVSLMVFKPNWLPHVFYPVGTQPAKRGAVLHSVGCDHNSDVTDYPITVLGTGNDPVNGRSIFTYQNSPRPGRSGGGLFDDRGYLIGICWGTSEKNGSGIGYFTTLEAIQTMLHGKGYDGLLRRGIPKPGQYIPIRDKSGKVFYSSDYIIAP